MFFGFTNPHSKHMKREANHFIHENETNVVQKNYYQNIEKENLFIGKRKQNRFSYLLLWLWFT